MKKKVVFALRVITIIIILISIWYIYDSSLWKLHPYGYHELVRLHVYSLLFGFCPIIYGISCLLEKER